MWQRIKNIYHLAQASLAVTFFLFPSNRLTVIAVTGTDGKTTTVNMIYHILKRAGKKVSMVSTIGAQIADRSIDIGYHVTTPSAWQLQKLLRLARNAGSQYFVLEATSHGLDQNRLAFININTAVLTNITSEHMDYHSNWQNYAASKSKLFKRAKFAILNLDDKKSFSYIKNTTSGKITTYSRKGPADYSLANFPLKLKVIGHYNLSNALAACASAGVLGIKKSDIITALEQFSGVKGRLEEISIGQPFKAIIDFAHTPNSLASALAALIGANPKSRIIAVFGSAGGRDKTKRIKMGEVAAKYADISIITSEDPRNENPRDIALEISRAFTKTGKIEGKDFFIVTNRQKAIQFAVNLAKKSDVVCFFGKGHEKSMCIGKKEYPWDEAATVKSAITAYLDHEKH